MSAEMSEEEQLEGIDPMIHAWLQSQGEREWHMFARSYNWDGGVQPLIWIAKQPACAAETAIEIFLGVEPFDFDHVQNLHDDCQRWRETKARGEFHAIDEMYCRAFKLVERISMRWRSNGYQMAGLPTEKRHREHAHQVDRTGDRGPTPARSCVAPDTSRFHGLEAAPEAGYVRGRS